MQKTRVKNKNYNLKLKTCKSLKNAIDFHGHLGPYLVLGLLMGDFAIKKLKCRKHFGIEAVIKGAIERPKSCLIDGIQISTGCTYGKGNIRKAGGGKIQVLFENVQSKMKVEVSLKNGLIRELEGLNGHKDSEIFARKLLTLDPINLFNF